VIYTNDETRENVIAGAKILYEAVKTTLGPKGQNVLIKTKFGEFKVTHDGVTVAKATQLGDDPRYPRGALIRYREWYGSTGEPNKGLRMTAEEVADGIKARESEKISYSVLDPAAFSMDGGPSIAERMSSRGVHFGPADNKRTGQVGAMGGWDQVRARLKGDEDGRPMVYIFSTGAHLIRTLPALQHDERKPEDVDTDAEDHAADEFRYALMSRPYVKDAPHKPAPKWETQLTVSELIERHRQKIRGD